MKTDIYEIFPREYPKEFLDLEKELVDIYKEIDKIMSVSEKFYLPVNTVKKKIHHLDTIIKKLGNFKSKEEIINIIIFNMIERAESVKVFLESKLNKKFEYTKYLKEAGINDKEILKYKKEIERINIQKKIESFLPEVKSLYQRPAITDEEQQEGKDLLLKLLKISFDSAPITVKEHFSNFENYVKTVQFIRNTGERSHHISGRINLNLSHLYMVEIVEWHNVEKILDAAYAADLIGEEGVLGHQGQFILSEKSNIPIFLKRPDHASRASGEALGNLGKRIMLDQINAQILGLDQKNMDLLIKNFELLELSRKIRMFIACYADYLLISKKESVKQVGEELSKLTGEPYYLSDLYVERVNNVGLPEFWKNWGARLETWSYIAADSLSDEIKEQLNKLPEDKRKKVLGYLYIGYWSSNSFKKYFEFLLKKFA